MPLLRLSMFAVLALSFSVPSVADARFDATPMSDCRASTACLLDSTDRRPSADLSLLQRRAKSYTLKNVTTSPARTGCAIEAPQHSRTLLLTVAQAGHGSTALLQLLMSSSKVSTLCSAETWQCEGIGIRGALRDASKSPTPEVDANRFMENLARVWNLERPVLLDKLFPDQEDYTELMRKAVSNANFEAPSALAKHGITKLVPAHIVMWTPLCVRRLNNQSVFKPRYKATGRNDIESEVYSLEELQRQHASLVSKGEPVIVISLADMIWRTDETAADLQRFLPCVGKLSSDFVPVLGQDVFPGNSYKVLGSMKSYGAAHDPQECCGFDLAKHTCKIDDAPYDDLGQFREKVIKLEAYFNSYTRVF